MRLSIGAFAKTPPVPKMPPGLVELMEGLSKEVLRNNTPSEDLHQFCADHMKKLLILRGASEGKRPLPLDQKIKRAQEKVNRTSEQRRQKLEEFLKQPNNIGNGEECIPSVSNQNEEPTIEEISKKVYELTSNVDDFQKALLSSDGNDNQVENASKFADEVTKEDVLTKKEIVPERKESSEHEDKVNEEHDVALNYTNELMFREMHQEMENSTMNYKDTIEGIEENRCNMNDMIHIGERNALESTGVIQTQDNNLHLNVRSEHETTNEVKQKDHEDIDIKHNAALEETIPTVNKTEDENFSPNETHDSANDIMNTNANGGYRKVTPEIIVNSNEEGVQKEKFIEENCTENLENEDTLEVEKSKDIETATINESCEVSLTVPKKEYNVANVIEIMEPKDVQSDDSSTLTNRDDLLNEDKFSQEKDITTTIAENPTTNVYNDAIASTIEIEVLNKNPDVIDEDNLKCNELSIITKADSNEQEPSLVSLNYYEGDSEKSLSIDEKNNTAITNHIDINAITKSDSINEESHDNVSDSTSEVTNAGMDLETAAVTIQKVFRSFMFKSRASTLDDSTNDNASLDVPYPTEDILLNEADGVNLKTNDEYHASNLKERRPLGIGLTRLDTVLQTVNEEKSLSLSDDSSMSSAATIIQAHVRGFLVRNKLHSAKTASSNSLANSDEIDNEPKNKTVLNIHIVPEGDHFVIRDESTTMSLDLPYDHSPPTGWGHSASLNLHPLSERRKQLKREDAIQSISPPSNNSGKLSDDIESVKDMSINENYIGINAQLLANPDPVILPNSENKTENFSEQEDCMKNIENQPIAIAPAQSLTAEADTVQDKQDADFQPSVENEENCLESSTIDLNNTENKPNTTAATENLTAEANEVIQDNDQSQEGDFQPSLDNKENYLESTTDKIVTKVVAEPILDRGNNCPGHENTSLDTEIESASRETTSESVTAETVVEVKNHLDEIANIDPIVDENSLTKLQSDEIDVVTKDEISYKTFAPSIDFDSTSKLLHSGEFHDVVLPTSVSRADSSIVREFKNVMVKYLLWNNSS